MSHNGKHLKAIRRARKMLAVMRNRLDPYLRLARLDRPIGTFLLLWPTMAALWLASGSAGPDPYIFLVFFLGVWLTRANGCIINDYADRNLDRHVARTRTRPLATGELKSRDALLLFVVLGLICFSLVLTLNTTTVYMSFVGMALTIFYPFSKRFFPGPQMVLGVVWSWSIPMAFTAQTGEVSTITWLMFVAHWCWTVAYDTMYGMVDRDDDLKVGIRSTAIWFGRWDRHWIAGLQVMTLGLLIAIGWLQQLGVAYYLALVVMATLFVHQQRMIANRDRDNCFKAFLNNQWAGLALFAGVVLGSGAF